MRFWALLAIAGRLLTKSLSSLAFSAGQVRRSSSPPHLNSIQGALYLKLCAFCS